MASLAALLKSQEVENRIWGSPKIVEGPHSQLPAGAGIKTHASRNPVLQETALKAVKTKISLLTEQQALLEQTVAKVLFFASKILTFNAQVKDIFLRLNIDNEPADSDKTAKASALLKKDFISLTAEIKKYNIFKDLLASKDGQLKDIQAAGTKFNTELDNLRVMLTEKTTEITLTEPMFKSLLDSLVIELTGSEVVEDDRVGIVAMAQNVQAATSAQLEELKVCIRAILCIGITKA